MSSWCSPFLDPKKLQNEQFYIIDLIRRKLLVDVANLAPCCLLLLSAPCCCLLLLAAAYLLLLTCCSPRACWRKMMLTPTRCIGITTPGDMFSTVSEQIDANIAFLPSRILARSVSFRCQVSTHRRFLDLHFLGNAQIIPTTAPDAMLMSRCPTGPKSTYLLFPRPHNGTGCYVNEPVPELIYAMLDFTGVDAASSS